MSNLLKKIGVIAVLSLAGLQAHALTINANGLTSAGCTALADCYPGPSGAPANTPSTSDLEALLGWTDNLTQYYKSDQGGFDGANYDTSFLNTPTDPEDATISLETSGTAMDCVDYGCFLLVKDGASDPNWYFFDISAYSSFAWNGTDTIYLEDFWVGKGAISHVALYGGTGKDTNGCLPGDPACSSTPPSVPEPSSLILLGLGLTALGLRKRLS